MTPISLFAYMMLTRIVLSVNDSFSMSRSIRPSAFSGKVGDAAAFLFKMLAGIENRLVLAGGGDDVIALLGIHLRDTLQREVVRFGRAAGEHDFLRGCANQIRDLLARLLNRLFRFPSEAMIAARRIAEEFLEIRQHRIEHARVDRGCCVVIEINGQLHRTLRSP